jgi:hypothetical protein
MKYKIKKKIKQTIGIKWKIPDPVRVPTAKEKKKQDYIRILFVRLYLNQ